MQAFSPHRKELLNDLKTSRHKGLSSQEAENRLLANGFNSIESDAPDPIWKIFLHALSEPIMIILWFAIALTISNSLFEFFVAENAKHGLEAIYEALVILIVIFINAGLTSWQSYTAQKSLNALQKMSHRQIKVLRDGDWQKIDAKQLVTGDIVEVRMGDFVEADLRWLSTSELQVDESHLTGESQAVLKDNKLLPANTELGDRSNMGYSASVVVNGSGIGVVTATGMDTELGKIAGLIQNTAVKQTPIEITINQLTRRLMILAAAVVILALAYNLIKEFVSTGQLTIADLFENVSGAIALAVGAIPDALPVVLSIVLTVGARQLAANNGLIKSLNSVETLGATTFIASDKTGTLTKNEMTVTRFYANGVNYEVDGNGYEPVGEILPSSEMGENYDYQKFLLGAVLNNEAAIQKNSVGNYVPLGNPTDVSLVVLARKAGLIRETLLNQTDGIDYDILRILPFESQRKMMSTVLKCEPSSYKLLTKGAPDVILNKAASIQIHGQFQSVDSARPMFDQQILDFAHDALRTIAVAERDLTEEEALHASQEELENDFKVLGLAGIIDPPRPEVRQSIKTLHEASIQVVMITGDHAATAREIAYRLGIVSDRDVRVVTGSEIEGMSDKQLFDLVKPIRVYARVAPAHKQRIVKALQQHHEIVAMTGDGVNDAAALRAANIGIAMGINGTEVTKDSADLILLDDKFTTIQKSVAAGRTVFANIQNFIRQELTTNVAEVLSLLFTTFLITAPIGHISEVTPTLTTLMVLWVNMISDSLPSFSLGYDEPEHEIMAEKPRDTAKSILSDHMWTRVLIRGFFMGLQVFLAFLWAASAGYQIAEAQTIAFLTLVFGQLWHVFDGRSSRSLFHRNPFSNPYLLAAVLFAAIASLTVTMLPFFNTLMGTRPLTWPIYLAVIFLPAIPTLVLSGMKEFWKIKIW
ncbi:MAG: cation-transporting P-type ATPase [Oenococcus sp.]|uniref:cation-translocating P-type ATPase n=1 Tax=Oenococcus sp. TaxID=1979414 RepID=UPI0039E8ED5F